MGWSTDLNPDAWRDGDARRRVAVPVAQQPEWTVVLRASFEVTPLPPDMARLLDRLR